MSRLAHLLGPLGQTPPMRHVTQHGASILGVRLTGTGFDRQWLPVSPGVTTVLLGKNGAGKTNALCGVLRALMVAIEMDWDDIHLVTDVLRGPIGGSYVADPGADLAPEDVVIVQPHLDVSYGRSLLAATLSEEFALSRESLHSIDVDMPALVQAYGTQSNDGERAFLKWFAARPTVAVGEKELSLAATPDQIDMTALDLATRVLRSPEALRPVDNEPSPIGIAARDMLDGRAAFPAFTGYAFADQSPAALGSLVAHCLPRAVPVDFSLDGVAGSIEEEVKRRTFGIAQQLCLSGKLEQPSGAVAKTVMPRVLALVAQRARDIAPGFILDYGDVVLATRDGDGPWDPPILTVRQTDGRNSWNIRDLGRGVASWAAAVVRIALAQLEDALWYVDADGERVGVRYRPGWHPPRSLQWFSEEVSLGIRPMARAAFELMLREPSRINAEILDPIPHVYLFDEPERHLHIAAVRDVLGVIDNLAQLGASCLVSTHAPAVIDLPESRSQLVLAVPSISSEPPLDHADSDQVPDGGSVTNNRLEVSAGIGLAELRRRASELGIDPSSLLYVTKGIIFVEGSNDKWVVETFFRDVLAAARVEVLSLSGGRSATGLAELELLWMLGKPVVVILDNVRRDLLKTLMRGRTDFKALRPEEQWVASLSTSLRRKNLQLHITGTDAPDIICAIADSDIKAAIAANGGDTDNFRDWETLLSLKGKQRFKPYFRETVGFTVEQVLSTLRRRGVAGQPTRDLMEAVHDALSYIASHQWHSLGN